jgi:hypothetical protein
MEKQGLALEAQALRMTPPASRVFSGLCGQLASKAASRLPFGGA